MTTTLQTSELARLEYRHCFSRPWRMPVIALLLFGAGHRAAGLPSAATDPFALMDDYESWMWVEPFAATLTLSLLTALCLAVIAKHFRKLMVDE